MESSRADEPVREASPDRVEEGIALCVSGGGYRAMLFHVGALWRLNELGYLAKLDRISSVSGGSITAATLGLHWGKLSFDPGGTAANLEEQLVTPVRRLAGKTIDVGSVLTGLVTPGSISDKVARTYRKHLFGEATLQDLPDAPRFVINATNLQTGALWRFSKPFMADYKVGLIRNPDVQLAHAVAASSAFPPVLSPARLRVDPNAFDEEGRGPLYQQPFNSDLVLSDGGVYDNLGLETAWNSFRTILVSDGGGQMAPAGEIASDWARQAIRVTAVIDNQVRNLRKRQIVAGYLHGDANDAYWGIRSYVPDFGPPPGSLPCPPDATRELAETPTRLEEMDAGLQERLINWGYAICDIAMRRWVVPDATPPERFPYPIGVG